MQRYQMLDVEIGPDEDGFEAVLARAYSLKQKPQCLCRRDIPLPLYIARRQDSHHLARWPGTGPRHAPTCDHYEAPDFLTGLGQVRGSAIVEDEESGETSLKFAFPLSRGPARAAPSSFTNDKPSVKTNGQKLTMRGLLHFLWDKAELTHWHPKMAGKRNWFVVRRALIQARLGCKVRGDSLTRALFIPETFNLDHKDEIAGRRLSGLELAYASPDAIMVVIGEVKAIEPARYGEKILVRHLPDWPFLMDADMARRFHKRFAVEEELWRSEEAEGHLVMAASFAVGASGLPQLFEIAVMPVNRHWLPYESHEERALVAKAVQEKRRFVKGLRVNLGLEAPIASIALKDTGAEATAIHLARNMPDPAYDEALAALMRTPGVTHVTWRPGDRLPDAQGRVFLPPPKR
ncbi:DUF1173 domain-containing protein [Novosphingobium sp. G106]|uniref:DUF1173 domain-containing protein n=1 Tax=Novosphingobium sp. G106 TaxID=2849500 RepID=UPI001C2DB846|nr:DUF1173 domain-containing protein [Novosphingobium sp. G106]MBV1692349.1 DUF1173 domain-containing protein [Novosphingobium sp. G106]